MSERLSVTEFPKWDYQEYPKTLPRDDFWGQTRRTIMGRRISETEVRLLVDHIREALLLQPSDILLDLGCGNGALAARLFDDCAGYRGVDLSAYLIEIANEYFERAPGYLFALGDVADYARSVGSPGMFTKILCFAVLQYLPPETVGSLLETVTTRFRGVRRIVFGNLPDRARARLFFRDGHEEAQIDRHESQIGRWWSPDEMRALAASHGWDVAVTRMPVDFFNASYRFDAVLTRP